MTRVPLRRRTVFGGGAALAVVLALPATGLGASAPATQIQVGDFNRTPPIAFNTLYPRVSTVTKGSKVTFTVFGFHSVTILGKGQKLSPLLVPGATLNPAQNDPAGAPYWWGGTTPLFGLNPAAAGPVGGKVVTPGKTLSSGFVGGDPPRFTVTFGKTGTYTIRCVVHPNMRGTVKVIAGTPGDTAKKAKARAAKEKAAQRKAVDALVKKAKAVAGNVVAISPGTAQAQLFAFVPAKRTVAVGSTVDFKMSARNEVHTVTFGPKAYVDAVSKKAFQGQGLDVAGEGFYPSDPPAAGVPTVTATSHGNGFVNSGVLSDPGTGIPAPKSFKVTFPQAGTFSYICLIHPEMRGTITVQ